MEFALKDTRVALTLVGVSIAPPAVPAGTLCQERRVFPAECRGLRSTYRGRITVRAAHGCPRARTRVSPACGAASPPHTRVPVPAGTSAVVKGPSRLPGVTACSGSAAPPGPGGVGDVWPRCFSPHITLVLVPAPLPFFPLSRFSQPA